MQHNKSTKDIEQIEKILQNDKQITQSISEVIDKFQVRTVFKEIDLVKRCGVLASTISIALLILPFVGIASVAALLKSGLDKSGDGQKDAYYAVKNNEGIAWRLLLLSLAKRFKFLVHQSNAQLKEIKGGVKQIRALIFDDSTLEKTGRKIEGIGYIHDHVKNVHILGYKLLVCGYWDGVSFIPLDFSLHKEKREGALKKTEERLAKKKQKTEKLEAAAQQQRNKKKEKKSLLRQAEKDYQTKKNKTNKNRIEQIRRAVERAAAKAKSIEQILKQQKGQEQHLANDLFDLKTNYRYCGFYPLNGPFGRAGRKGLSAGRKQTPDFPPGGNHALAWATRRENIPLALR